MEMQATHHPLISSLPTLFSWWQGCWGEALDKVMNTLFSNDPATCGGGRSSWHSYMDYLTYSFFVCTSTFTIGLGKYSYHYSSKTIQACGMWLASLENMLHDGLYSYRMSMPLSTNNQ
jgi:hypothetical protein